MADKIVIKSDGTVKGTKVTVNDEDMTDKYKVTNVNFNANGGYTYKSQYSGETYVNPPSVSYGLSYLDNGKEKSIGVNTQLARYEYGNLNQKDSIIGIGLEDNERIKEKILDSFDNLREKHPEIKERKLLEKRTLDSLLDNYLDTVNEIELQAKIKKE